MSYVVLARKYRPRDFEGMVGQEHVVQALANALTQQRLHHAYLFTGTRGVGKTTVSRILAKSLNCTGPDGQGGITAHPCGRCDACRDIDAGRFVDYVELDAASNRGVEEISTLLDQAVYKPVVGRFKVYMIDEVHMLSNTAFNAMLKTLEEPPEYLKFVLATTDPQKVPPTVLSRCLQFNLRPMAPATVQSHLAQVLGEEGVEGEPGALRLLARAARGSMRDALSLTDQAIAYGGGRVLEATVRQMLGAVDRSHAVRFVQALAAGDGPALVKAADDLRDLGLSASGTLDEFAALLQQMALAQAVPTALDDREPDAALALRLADALAPDETQLCYRIALQGRSELGLAPDEHAGLVMVLLRMLAFRPQGPGAARVEAGQGRASTVAAGAAVAAEGAHAQREVVPPVAAVGVNGTAEAPGAGVAAPATVRGAPAPAPRALAASAPTVGLPPAAPVAAARPEMRPAPPDARHAAAPLKPAATAAAAAPSMSPPQAAPAAASDEPPPWLDADDHLDAVPAASPPPDRPASASGARERSSTAATAPTIALQRTPLGDRWAALVVQMAEQGAIAAMVRELAAQAECIAVEPRDDGSQRWCLRVERETLRAPAQIDKLQAAMARTLGHPVRLEVDAGAALDSPALRTAAERERRQREAEQIIHDDPLVQALMAQYSTARIVPGSIKPH